MRGPHRDVNRNHTLSICSVHVSDRGLTRRMRQPLRCSQAERRSTGPTVPCQRRPRICIPQPPVKERCPRLAQSTQSQRSSEVRSVGIIGDLLLRSPQLVPPLLAAYGRATGRAMAVGLRMSTRTRIRRTAKRGCPHRRTSAFTPPVTGSSAAGRGTNGSMCSPRHRRRGKASKSRRRRLGASSGYLAELLYSASC